MKSTAVGTAFRMLFDAMADGMLLVDPRGRILLSNPALRTLLGYAESELAGMAVEALVPAPHRATHARQRQAYARRPTARAMGAGRPLTVACRDGRELPVDIGLSPLQIDGRECTLVTLHDATLRRHTEATLQASEERLRLAKRAAGLGVYDYDLCTGTMHCDEHIRLLWGLDMQEPVTHEMLQEGIHPPDRAIRQAAWERALDPAGNGQYATEYRIISRDDCQMRWVSVIGQVFFEAGRPRRQVGVVRDITDQKAAEQKIQQQRREMESLLKHQVAAQTASAIAHELNQPLVAISAYSESALRLLEDSGDQHPDLRHALSGSVAQAQRAGKTLHELLAFLQGGQAESVPIDLNACIRDAIAALQRDGYGEFQPVLELAEGLPLVQGNRIQVQKVLDNLLRNSVEAMRAANLPAGAMRIRVQTASVAGMARVSVLDSGPGIGADKVRRIFEPFYTTKSSGIGMGLAISRSLIETLGGRLWLDTDNQGGAAFHFTLPLAP